MSYGALVCPMPMIIVPWSFSHKQPETTCLRCLPMPLQVKESLAHGHAPGQEYTEGPVLLYIVICAQPSVSQPSPPLRDSVVTNLKPLINVFEVIIWRIPLQYRKHSLFYYSSLHLWAVTSTSINTHKIACTCLLAIWMFAKCYSWSVAFQIK